MNNHVTCLAQKQLVYINYTARLDIFNLHQDLELHLIHYIALLFITYPPNDDIYFTMKKSMAPAMDS